MVLQLVGFIPVVVVVLAFSLVLHQVRRDFGDLSRRIRALEDARAGESGARERLTEDVRGLIRSGRKIEAVKRYRDTEQTSLSEAARAVDVIAAAEDGRQTGTSTGA